MLRHHANSEPVLKVKVEVFDNVTTSRLPGLVIVELTKVLKLVREAVFLIVVTFRSVILFVLYFVIDNTAFSEVVHRIAFFKVVRRIRIGDCWTVQI